MILNPDISDGSNAASEVEVRALMQDLSGYMTGVTAEMARGVLAKRKVEADAEVQMLMEEVSHSVIGVTEEMMRGAMQDAPPNNVSVAPKPQEVLKAPEQIQRHAQSRIRDAVREEDPAEERARVAKMTKEKAEKKSKPAAPPKPKPARATAVAEPVVQPAPAEKKGKDPRTDIHLGAEAEAFVAKVEQAEPMFPVSEVPKPRDLDLDEYEEHPVFDGDYADEWDEDYEYEDIDFEALGIDPKEPTKAKPGSEEKMLVLAARYAAGVPLWHEGDCYEHGNFITNFASPREAQKKSHDQQ